ncbi:HAMP domain-containing sensor histidine kinase [Clostridium senegalense]|uniref:HAMP domain-containing sensor histidine kinase n=1 Tax=Clostridium senegalense TaxID=1465809 RepID=UPI001C111BE2|nr:HAMP domain-containing sensor histidine kinase [Clostridium senegalense]MBU5225631.1 cell wall metabolism sensor histidine kinase WalK [Clostridium senegalense]
MKKTKSNGSMKRKITVFILGAIVSVLILVTILFLNVLDYQRQENAKETFKIYANAINGLIERDIREKDKIDFIRELENEEIRVTILKNDLTLIYDSVKDNNYDKKEEVNRAYKYGESFLIRRSNHLNSDTIYYAKKYENHIVRISRLDKIVENVDKAYIALYVALVITTLIFSVWISSKLSYVIAKPISDLQKITSMIADGELDRRVKITTNDEIGKLGQCFNGMANKLEFTLNEVKEKQNRLSAILQSMDSGLIAIDINNKVIMLNAYTKKIFNIDRDVIGENINNICKDFDMNMLFEDLDKNYKEIKIEISNETYLRVRTAEIINRSQHIGKVAVIQDVTDVKRLENVRSEFVANVSHELKTPLTSIKGFTETLKYVEDEETRNKFLGIIEEESDRLTTLISDILILSDIERQIDLKLEQVDVNVVIENVYELMKNFAQTKNMNLNMELNQLNIVVAEKDKLKQMIINLVDNAIKYSEGNNVVIRTKNEKNGCIIEVEDDGVGIASEHLPRLFERFYRVDKDRSRSSGGTGLGLAIVKHIALKFDANIQVESNLGKGTKFQIWIPYEKM